MDSFVSPDGYSRRPDFPPPYLVAVSAEIGHLGDSVFSARLIAFFTADDGDTHLAVFDHPARAPKEVAESSLHAASWGAAFLNGRQQIFVSPCVRSPPDT